MNVLTPPLGEVFVTACESHPQQRLKKYGLGVGYSVENTLIIL
jgi:hypothetical protein